MNNRKPNENEALFGIILDIGVALIRNGAETHRVEDSLYRLCSSYGYTRSDIWVVPSNIQGTVTASDGSVITQIRHVRNAGIDLKQLEELNALCRWTCASMPDSIALQKALDSVKNGLPARPVWKYIAAALAGTGFGIFFHCDYADALVAMLTSLIITFLCSAFGRHERNPLMLNFLISAIAEAFILICVRHGVGHHADYITVGVVMLLISALGTTNGIRDLIHLDTLSGVINISSSFTGAIGIAFGIALPLLLMHIQLPVDSSPINPSALLQLAGCTVGCIGFSIWFHVRNKHIPFCALGALLTWSVFTCSSRQLGLFLSILLSAAVCAVYAQFMARIRKCPATVFQTISIFPLIPGSALYYMMYGAVTGDQTLAVDRGLALLLTCVAIVLGFLIVEACISFCRQKR